MTALSLPKLFRKRITERLPDIADYMIWDKCDMHAVCCLRIPAASPEGFDLEIHVNIGDISIFAGGRARLDFMLHGNQSELVEEAIDMAHDLLTPKMRVRVEITEDMPVYWYIEANQGKQWEIKEKVFLLSWNISKYFKYFKSKEKSEKIYQNNRLAIIGQNDTSAKV